MSHIETQTEVTLKEQHLDCLKKAAESLGCTWLVNAEARHWNGNSVKAPFVIRTQQNTYDVAVQRQPDGTYALATDWYASERGFIPVEQVVGKAFGRLHAAYKEQFLRKEASRHGYTVRRTVTAAGKIQLVVTGV